MGNIQVSPFACQFCRPLNTTRDVSKNTPEKNYKIKSLLSLEASFPIGHLVCSRWRPFSCLNIYVYVYIYILYCIYIKYNIIYIYQFFIGRLVDHQSFCLGNSGSGKQKWQRTTGSPQTWSNEALNWIHFHWSSHFYLLKSARHKWLYTYVYYIYILYVYIYMYTIRIY